MDGSQATRAHQDQVEAQIREIKANMPQTYRSIQAKAQEIGRAAYAYVRRGLAGQPNQFYAMEAGRVMGTPFADQQINADVALLMVTFGAGFVVIWPQAAKPEEAHGPQ